MDQQVKPYRRPGFFKARWDGVVRLDRVFWIDMMVVGTAINLATSFAALMVLGFKGALWASLLVYALPLPYNLFLVVAVWRSAEHTRSRSFASTARMGALAWLVVATLI